MAKHKTRQQKIIAELRRQLSVDKTAQFSPSKPIEFKATKPVDKVDKIEVNKKPALTVNSNPYLAYDLKKTAFLTTGILLTQAAIFFLLTKHIFILPGLNY